MKVFFLVLLVFGSVCFSARFSHASTPVAGEATKAAEALGWRLGMQAYSFNRFSFFEAVEKTAALGLKWIEAYPGQRLSQEKPDSKFHHAMPQQDMDAALEKLKAEGVQLVNYGVVGLGSDEAECRKVFDFAKKMGIETITSEPEEAAFELIDRLCNEYAINVAIHNHPKPSRYFDPDAVLRVCEGRSERIGACADTGHWMRSFLPPLECLQKLEGRIVSFHFKDLNGFGPSSHDVPWGTGKADVRELLTEIHRQKIKAVFSIEYEHNWDNSMPEIAQCVEYFEKVAKDIGTAKHTGALLGTISVQSGEIERQDTPVSVALSALPDPWRPLRLFEVKGEQRIPIPSQMDPGNEPRLWWILSGKTPANTVRTFEVYEGDPVGSLPVLVRQEESSLEITARGGRVIRYNHGYVVPPIGDDPRYIRSGYIHPAWSPAGLMVTEDFPADHLHHKGIWSAWTKTQFEGRHPDFWNLKGGTGTVRFSGFGWNVSGPVFGGFAANMVHTDLSAPTPKAALNEQWDVRVWNIGGQDKGYWLWDLTSVQNAASESPLHLPEYRYGGFGFRGSVDWVDENLHLLTSEGKTRADGHGTKSRWCDMSGPIGAGYAGVTILTHPSNFQFPQPMRIWDKGGTFFCYAPPLDGDFDIEPGKDFVSRYRYFVHDGKADQPTIERVWNDFANPPSVEAKF